MYDCIIKDGYIVSSTETIKSDIGILNGKIVAIESSINEEAKRIINVKGKYVLPGAIDPHMHVMAPFQGCYGANNFYTQSISAAFGGITMFMDFSNTFKGTSVFECVKKRNEEMAVSSIDYSIHGKIVEEKQCDELEQLVNYGCATFKLFMTYKKEGVMSDDETLIKAFTIAKKLNAMPMVHCESNAMAEDAIKKCIEERRLNWEEFSKSKPILCENEAFSRAVYFSKYAGNGLIVVHTTNGGALDIARKAHKEGMPLYVETCPHYLTLFDSIYKEKNGHLAICSPPLRTAKEAEELWEGIKDGTISVTGSDDCTYSYEEKSMFLDKDPNSELIKDFTKVVNGLSGIEIRLPIFLSEGVSKGRISINKVVALTSENIAKVYGCYPQKGTISIGSDADIVIVDMAKEVVLGADKLHNNIDYCLNEGMKIKGYPIITISNGKVIVENGKFYGQKGDGKFIKRNISEKYLTNFPI